MTSLKTSKVLYLEFTVIDLFCGCGGLGLGLKKVGLIPIFSVDTNETVVKTYRNNVSKNVILEDVKNIKFKNLDADVIVGGLPCQGFSTLGKMNSTDERNYLWKEFLRALAEVKPKAFLVENVPRFLNSFHFNKFKEESRKLGYNLIFDVLDASKYEVPQIRKRAIIIGSRKSVPKMPKKTVEKAKTVRDAIGDLSLEPNGKNDHNKRYDQEHTLERFKHIPPGGDWRDLPDKLKNPCWKRLKGKGYQGVFGRLKWDEPSVTLRTNFLHPECGRFIHPKANRGLTVREGARIQGFPDEFRFLGSSASKAKMIGNAVPVPFAEALGNAILSLI